jgi:hypothetical protein
MHLRLSHTPLLLLAALPAASPLRADPVNDARAGIQAAYDQICGDFERRDIDDAMGFFAPDYCATDEHGRPISRDETRRQFLDLNGTITSLHCHWTLGAVTPVPGGALADMDMCSDGTGRKKVMFFHVNGTFTSEMRVRDTWADTPQGWRLKRRTILLHDTQTRPG